jgi:hypothetical protein
MSRRRSAVAPVAGLLAVAVLAVGSLTGCGPGDRLAERRVGDGSTGATAAGPAAAAGSDAGVGAVDAELVAEIETAVGADGDLLAEIEADDAALDSIAG